MFKADIFSEPKPVFTKVTDTVQQQLIDFMSRYYSKIGVIKSICQSGAMELNSNNFLIEIGSEKHILKKGTIPISETLQTLNEQAALVNALFLDGIRVPAIIRNDDSQLITVDANCYWCLMEFVDGDYFEGAESQLENAGVEMLNLFSSLNKLALRTDRFQLIYPLTELEGVLLKDFEKISDNWPSFLGEDYANLLLNHWEEINLLYEEILVTQKQLVNDMTLVHYDIHPHNVLMKGNEVAAILDFGSLVIAPKGVTFSFNLFKLARQAIVFRKGDCTSSAFLKQKTNLIDQAQLNGLINVTDNLALLAKTEILRRAFLILRLNLENNNSIWNHVLPIQLNALKEADMFYH